AAARAPVFVVRAVRRPPRPTPFPYTTLFRSIGADEGAVADAGGRLVHAVVVAGDGAGTDVDAGADLGIAQVAEVVGLAAGAQAGLLGFDEIADVHALGQLGAGAEARVGADAGGTVAEHAFQVAMGADLGAGGQLDIAQPAERADAHAVAKHHPAFEHHVHVDLDVAAGLDRAAQVEAGRVGQAHAGAHQGLGGTALVAAFQLRQLQ